jgi:pyruvate,water dikinase
MPRLVVPLNSREAADANRFGPKAANLARLDHAGMPTPGGFCLDAEAYRIQLRGLGLEADARGVFGTPESTQAKRHALNMKLGLLDNPIALEVLDPLLAAWRDLRKRTGVLLAVRSSALVEDRYGSSFAGQFESFLGIETEFDFITAVRSCWGALWATRALRYMATYNIDPADTAMAILVQPLVVARTAGGALSRSSEDTIIISATWGLGSAIAQGEVTPDRYELSRDGVVLSMVAGSKDHEVGCIHRMELETRTTSRPRASEPCLTESQARELGLMIGKVEELMGMAVEIEWAMDSSGFKLLQARPLHLQQSVAPGETWSRRPRLNGHPAGVGWASGRACVINCECELSRVAPGDVLVTRVATPALSHMLMQVAGVVAERGGSTSHMASLARERGIPMVLGVPEATTRIPAGSIVAVDGVAGVVRWMMP